jgi:hypothetical protein
MRGLGCSDRLCGEQLLFGWSDSGPKVGMECSDFGGEQLPLGLSDSCPMGELECSESVLL